MMKRWQRNGILFGIGAIGYSLIELAFRGRTHWTMAVTGGGCAVALYRMHEELLTGKAQILSKYKRDCITLGREISVVRGEQIRHGTALDIDEDGALIVRYPDGSIENINSGEVSIRGMYGYV